MTHQERFSSLMQEAAILLDQLILLLEEERSSLSQNNAALTQTILTRKTELLTLLEQNSQQRNQFLASQGLSTDDSGVQAYFKSLTQTVAKSYAEKWQVLEEKLENCKAENLINGKIIHRSRQQVDVLLNLLQGNSGASKIYTENGQAKSVNRQHPLAEA